jgi:murein DD-endopeptidase MepM/ murein hydrolase activator NlpD
VHLPHPRAIRGHGRAPLVVVTVLLVALVSLALPSGAIGAPVAPAPVGVWPLQPTPEVVRAFEPPDSRWGPGHRGVDLAGSIGQVVHAALPGRVSYAAGLAGRGVVVVDHGRTRTTYEPVTATVRVGDPVGRGQPIGVLELTDSHCFPAACLHWGWRRGTTYLDPLLLVRGGPIVLLPLWRDPPTPRAGAWSPRSALVEVSPLRYPYADVPARGGPDAASGGRSGPPRNAHSLVKGQRHFAALRPVGGPDGTPAAGGRC